MKKGFLSIMDAVKGRKVLVMICAIVVTAAAFLSINVFVLASAGETERYIGLERAKAIALEHAGISEESVTFIKARLDYDDGYVVYDVEFYSGNTEYDYEINAVSGAVIEHDLEIEYQRRSKNPIRKSNTPENSPQQSGNQSGSQSGNQSGNAVQYVEQYIGEAKAKNIALSDAGLSENQVGRVKVELDRENGIMVYEVEFNSGRTEYEYEINAIDGTIIKVDIDYD